MPSIRPFASAPVEVRELAIARLAESGLEASDGMKLGMDALAPFAVMKLDKSFHARPALKIAYLMPDGTPAKAKPMWPDFFRLRYLGMLPPSFADLTEGKSPPKYVQPPRSGVCAYFPTGVGVDWKVILDNPTEPITITEGELKAAKACVDGHPTIGLGGVWSWRSGSLGLSFLPELAAIDWVGRTVFMAFDSDSSRNQQVTKALWELAQELALRGALPYVVTIPELIENGKTGLDDFLLLRGSQSFDSLLEEAQSITLADTLWRLNKEVAYIQDPGLIVVKQSSLRMSPSAFTGHAYSARPYSMPVLKEDGSVGLKRVPAPEVWMSWPLREELTRMTYNPGEEMVTPKREYNLWKGWGCEPKKGDLKPWNDLLDHVFTGTDKMDRVWFERWCAWPIQHPGHKLHTSVVIQGINQGTGKSLIGETLGAVYGKNYGLIKQADLHNTFNDWAECKQFILADDVTGTAARKEADMLKTMITQKEIRINVKFIPTYVVPDRVNYLWTTNHLDAFYLEDMDRRFFIHEVVVQPLPDEFYTAYKKWLESFGPSALFYYLLHLDLGNFNPAAPAKRTDAKERMIAETRSDVASWVRGLIAEPDVYLRSGRGPLKGDLWTSRELLNCYDPQENSPLTANGMGRNLRQAGIPLACGGVSIKGPSGRSERYYVVRNFEQWRKAKPKNAQAHIHEERGFNSIDQDGNLRPKKY